MNRLLSSILLLAIALPVLAQQPARTPQPNQPSSKQSTAKQPKAIHAPVKEPALRDELLRMREEDQRVRFEVIQELQNRGISLLDGPLEKPFSLETIWQLWQEAEVAMPAEAVDTKNRARMHQIVAKYGWPGKSLVGKDASRAAWLLVQHADDERPFQRHCLDLMRAMPKGEVRPDDIAYLTDRVLVGEHKKQIYGTQLESKNAHFVIPALEDPMNVDKRRAEVGLGPLAQYLKTSEQFYSGEKPLTTEAKPVHK